MTEVKTETVFHELADRCEHTAGPDRELDALIWCALHGVKYQGHNPAYASFGHHNPETQVEFTTPPRRTRCVTGNVRFPHAQPVTASLDASMTMVGGDQSFWFILTEAAKRCAMATESNTETEFRKRLPAFVSAAALRAITE